MLGSQSGAGSELRIGDKPDKCKMREEATYLSESSVPFPSRADEYGIPPLTMEFVSDSVSSATCVVR